MCNQHSYLQTRSTVRLQMNLDSDVVDSYFRTMVERNCFQLDMMDLREVSVRYQPGHESDDRMQKTTREEKSFMTLIVLDGRFSGLL